MAVPIKQDDLMKIVDTSNPIPKYLQISFWLKELIETGRYQDYADDQETETAQFWHEVRACQYKVREGPGKLMSWGVWESPGFDGSIAYGHDDLLISAAMCSVLDQQDWPGTGPSAVVHRQDELDEIDKGEW